MAVGFRVFTKIKRADKELVEAFGGVPVANIADNMGRIYCVGTSIKPYGRKSLLGMALTVKTAPGDNLMVHKALDMAEPGDVIMVDGEGSMDHSLCGEIMFTYAKKRGIAGVVVDGCIRDADSLPDMDFPVYARGVQPKGPYKNGPGEINVPVSVGGIVVFPGDIIVGDGDGVVVIRPSDAPEVLRLSKEQFEKEQKAFEEIKNGEYDRTWIDKTIRANGGAVIDDYYK